MGVSVSSEGLAAGPRQELWRQAMSETFVPLDVVDLGMPRSADTIRTSDVGELMIADLASSRQEIRRTGRLIARSDRELFQIAVARRGRAFLDQDGREVALGPGDFTVYETGRPFRWAFADDWAATVFTLPRASLAMADAESRLLTARRLSGQTGSSAVVSRFICDLAAHAESEPWRQSRRVVADIIDLVIALVTDQLEVSETARSSRQRALLLQIKAYIGEHLTDPGLTPAGIAAAHHVSVRYVHRLFEGEPLSVAALIRQERLARCARSLLDPRLAHQSVTALAAAAGFADLTGFGRAFKTAYGMTPTQYRSGQASGKS
jgi:AraC-like DNA-binding protein